MSALVSGLTMETTALALSTAQNDDHGLDGVVGEDDDAIAARDAAPHQRVGQRVGARVELRVGEPLPWHDQRHLLGQAARPSRSDSRAAAERLASCVTLASSVDERLDVDVRGVGLRRR